MKSAAFTGLLAACSVVVFIFATELREQTKAMPRMSFQEAWSQSPACTLRLVAYRTDKSSSYYLEEVGTGHLFEMHGLGGRRIPTIALGESVHSKCDQSAEGKRITEFEYYRQSIVVSYSGTITRTLPGYEYLARHM